MVQVMARVEEFKKFVREAGENAANGASAGLVSVEVLSVMIGGAHAQMLTELSRSLGIDPSEVLASAIERLHRAENSR